MTTTILKSLLAVFLSVFLSISAASQDEPFRDFDNRDLFGFHVVLDSNGNIVPTLNLSTMGEREQDN